MIETKIISIKKNTEFRRLYRRGKSVVKPTMVLYALPNRLPISRLGITAGKKVGGAVQRNRAKRRIRELYRRCRNQIKKGYDFCAVARTRTVHASAEQISRDFCAAAKELGVWMDERYTD